jgi:hypothetical protein
MKALRLLKGMSEGFSHRQAREPPIFRFRCETHHHPSLVPMKFNRNIGMILLAIFLIMYGLTVWLRAPFGDFLPIVALAAGIFILIGK